MSHALTCYRCGAVLPAQAAHAATPCSYCGAVAVPEPRVIERVIERVVVASSSNHAAGDALRTPTATGPNCPQCAVPLREGTSGVTTLQGCDHCYGVWLARADVERLLRERDPDIIQNVRRLYAHAFAPRSETRANIACIVCGQTMRRVPVPVSILSLDICDEHGVWFDWPDLPAFVHACEEMRAGSIDDEIEIAGLPRRKKPEYEEERPDPSWVRNVLHRS